MIVNTKPHPVITTEHLILRPLRSADAEAIFAIRSNERVNAYLDRPAATEIADAVNFIENIHQLTTSGDGLYWGIALATTDEVIGTICLYNFDIEKEMAEMGYELLPAYQGKGVMREAVTAIIDHGFNIINAKVLTACPRKDNLRSEKLLQASGFTIDPTYADLNEQNADSHLRYVLKRGF